MTLYSLNGPAPSQKDILQESIRDNMNDGYFDDPENDIIRVQYIQIDPEINSGTNQEGRGVPNQIDPRGNGLIVGIMVGTGLVVVALVAVAYRRRKRSAEEMAETVFDGDSHTAGQVA